MGVLTSLQRLNECCWAAEARPALRGLLLCGVHILVPLAQLAQLKGALLGNPGSLGFMPQALVLQGLLQLQDPSLSSACYYVLQ